MSEATAQGTRVRGTLARRRLGAGALTIFLISASGPMTVLVGAMVTAFAVTGNVGTPLCYPILAVALALFSVGYAAMSRYVQSAGGFYPYAAQGLGPAWGVAASFVAVLSYSAVQIGLVGLFGVVARDFAGRYLGLSLTWWAWSAVGLGVVAVFGVRKVDLNARVLLVLLACEVGGYSPSTSVRSPTRSAARRASPACRPAACWPAVSAASSPSAWPATSASSRAPSTARRPATRGVRSPAPRTSRSPSLACCTRCPRGH